MNPRYIVEQVLLERLVEEQKDDQKGKSLIAKVLLVLDEMNENIP